MFVHVPSAWMALFVYALMALASAAALIWRHPLAELAAQEAAPLGAGFTLICLVSGSLWGEPMWGTWWVWDARLTSVLVLFFIIRKRPGHRGRVDGVRFDVDELGELDRVEIAGTGPLAKLVKKIASLDDVQDASESEGAVHVLVRGGRHVLPKLIELADAAGVGVSSVDVIEPDLEAVFLHLTGKALRD